MHKEELIRTACRELLTYGKYSNKALIKYIIKKYVLRRQMEGRDLIFWTTGILAVGLWRCRQEILNLQTDILVLQDIETSLSVYFARWLKKRSPICYLDDLVAGEVLLAVCIEYDRLQRENGIINKKNTDRYHEAVEKMVEYALSYPKDKTGSFPYRVRNENQYIYVDAIGLACPFLYEYGKYKERISVMELAIRQIENFLAYGMDKMTGLPYHGYDMITGDKYGIIGWGRAVGWLMRGMIGCMTSEYGIERLKKSYCDLIDAVLIWQRNDGYWSWQLQAKEGKADTSSTGMICLALQEGLRRGLLRGDIYSSALARGVLAIGKSTKNGRVYDCLGECEGFSRYPQTYGDYPWAQGIALMLADLH